MQIKALPETFTKIYDYSKSHVAIEFYRNKYEPLVKKWQGLKQEGVNDATCAETLDISKATYYRWRKHLDNLDKGILPPSKRRLNVNKPKWGEKEKQLVIKVRREASTFGKDKIGRILRRDYGIAISDSTVGRIITYLLGKNVIARSESAPVEKRPRRFKNKHAQPWEYKKYGDMVMGERIQIDHMTVTKNQTSMKHFQAWDRKSKYLLANVYSNATAKSAKRFLLELVEKCPFPILSIQVDGGSEFMAEFEQTCADLNIPLMVLPPRKPKYNGGVERGNRIFREEFYARQDLLVDTITGFREELKKANDKYNKWRPHFSLKGLTPMEYINSNLGT